MDAKYSFTSFFQIYFYSWSKHFKGDCHKWWSCVDGYLSRIDTCEDQIPSGGNSEDFIDSKENDLVQKSDYLIVFMNDITINIYTKLFSFCSKQSKIL